MSRDLWLSIHPVWVEKILNGEKTVELRRTRPAEAECSAIIYSTAPVSAAVAIAAVESVVELEVDELWQTFGERAAISKREFDEYFSGQACGTAILLADISQLVEEVHFEEIARITGIKPAQGWRYIEPETTASVVGLAAVARV